MEHRHPHAQLLISRHQDSWFPKQISAHSILTYLDVPGSLDQWLVSGLQPPYTPFLSRWNNPLIRSLLILTSNWTFDPNLRLASNLSLLWRDVPPASYSYQTSLGWFGHKKNNPKCRLASCFASPFPSNLTPDAKKQWQTSCFHQTFSVFPLQFGFLYKFATFRDASMRFFLASWDLD